MRGSRHLGRCDPRQDRDPLESTLVPAGAGREPRHRRELAEVPATTQISPELVLVSPELAERARAALLDRPWEMFLPRLSVVTTQPAPLVAPPAARRSWPGRVAAAVPTALIAGFAAVIVAGSLPWLGDRPTLGPPEPAPPRALARTTPARYAVRDSNEAQLLRRGLAATGSPRRERSCSLSARSISAGR